MPEFRKIFFIAIFCILLSSTGVADTSLSNLQASITDEDGDGEYVMGREVTSTFDYTINDPYQPVDTALVIDESGSMGGVLEDAKDAANSYIDNTNTAQGDENAVIEFANSATELQSLTGDKSAARSAVNGISDGGGTDLPAGVSAGEDALSTGSNPVQVMIVLADGGGGNPSTEADDARDAGIEVHGIMYGSGASTSEFEGLTGASDCTTDSSENSDGDTCWYAESGTVTSVYQSIRETTEEEIEVTNRMRLLDNAYASESGNDLSGPNTEYTEYRNDPEAGTYSDQITWYPTQQGNMDILTGDSRIDLTSGGSTDYYYFDRTENRDVKYVDFDVTSTSIVRESGTVEIDATVRNDGNTRSREREVWIRDESGNTISRTLPRLDAGESESYSFSIDGSDPVVGDAEMIYFEVDPTGVWDSRPYGEGDTLEPNEANNVEQLGFPPRITDFDPDTIDYGDSYTATMDIEHVGSSVSGTYDFTKGGNGYESSELEHDGRSLSYSSDVVSTDSFTADKAESSYLFEMTIEDENGATTNYEVSRFVQNPPPVISNPSPQDNGYVSDSPPVDLQAYATDENDNQLTLYLYNHSDDYLLHKETISAGGYASTDWDFPDTLTEQYWRVVAEDRWDNTTRIFKFTHIAGSAYRVDTSFETDYSSVIMPQQGSRTLRFELRNRLPDEREFQVDLSGVDATFSDGTDSQSVSVPGRSSETVSVFVSPQSTGDKDLEITTTDESIGVSNVDTIPVYVREFPASAVDRAPGLMWIQLLFLAAGSTFLYSALL